MCIHMYQLIYTFIDTQEELEIRIRIKTIPYFNRKKIGTWGIIIKIFI